MREMKNSSVEWIGEIPANWEVKKFKHVADIYTGNSIKDEEKSMYEDPNEAVPYIATKDIKSVFNTVDYGNGIYIKNDDLSFVRAYSGDTLMCIEGGSAGKKKARIDRTVCFVNKLCCFHATAINSDFLYYILNSPNYEEEFMFNITGLIGGVSKNKLMNFVLPFPSLPEQHCIADFLDEKCAKIDAVIEKQKQVIEKLKEYKLSVITEAVTKGLDPTVPMKDSGVEYAKIMPGHWENRKMISILSMRVVDGPHESPELFDEGIPYISATAIENGKIDFEKMRGYISEEYCDECDKRYKPQVGDVLIVKLGASTGQVAIVETDRRFNIWVPLAVVRCNEYALPKFVYYAFQSDYFIKQMEQSWTYGTQQTLGVKTIERLRILLPNIEEQKEIVSFLEEKCSQFDTAIAKKQAIVEKLTEYKKSLIYEVVTGKREV